MGHTRLWRFCFILGSESGAIDANKYGSNSSAIDANIDQNVDLNFMAFLGQQKILLGSWGHEQKDKNGKNICLESAQNIILELWLTQIMISWWGGNMLLKIIPLTINDLSGGKNVVTYAHWI